ncbi:MAG TPA: nuclear transport factor 2 family protein [Terracidiphilus sp.]|nr:nuclear transport factor 2 family protein [Terracidiphilus sp.]
MIRFNACLAVFFLSCCVAIAQSPAPTAQDPPSTPGSAQPAVTSTQSPEITQFQKIEDNWAHAVNQHDQYSLENVLSPLFVDVAATGDITTRNQQLAQVIAGEDKTMWLTQKVITVRMLGDIAVANGTYTLHHKVNTTQVDEKGVFTHVYERLRGGWVCVNSQRTALRADSAGGKQKKPSTAEEPFHIPLFSRGDKGEKSNQ